MNGKLRRTAVVMGVGFLLVGMSSAFAGENERGRFHLGTSTGEPGAPTGLKFRVLYKNPADPLAKPPPITAATFRLPKGMRIDTGAVPQCDADDAQIRALGVGACPADTRVGTGRLLARTGTPGADEVRTDVVAFNGPEEIIEVVFFEGTNVVAGIDRLSIERNVLTAHPPSTPGGPPDGRTAVREIFLEVPARVAPDGRAYVTTPKRCLRGKWKGSADYEFADGGSTTVLSRTRCLIGAGG